MMHLAIVIDIRGAVDQSGLDRLRTHLSLQHQGRLTDDWDQEFGYRVIDFDGGQRINIGLFREFDGSWVIDASTAGSLFTNHELAMLSAELVTSITAAGYEAVVRATPTYGGPNPGD